MRTGLAVLATFAIALTLLPMASAHERYFTSDGNYLLVIGEQDEPVYTYDWTNLDFFVRDNATGDPITGVEDTVTVTLVAPNGAEMTRPLSPQFGVEGEYEFEEGYLLTLPGQYSVRLDGDINGTDVTGEYLLPGPRGDMTDHTFPHQDIEDLRELHERMAQMEAHMDQMMMDGNTNDNQQVQSPGFAWLPVLIGAVLGLALRARRET